MRWKNKISVARNLYSILIVFLIFSTNFLPLLNLLPSSSFAQDEPISETILEEQSQNIIQNDATSADEKHVIIDDQTTKQKEESVDLNQQPKKEEPVQKSVIQPETQPTEKIEVLVADSGVGALNTIAENVIYDCNPASILSCITTDKEDYAPTDIVKILGYAYEPKELYELLIYSNDDPAVRFVTDIVASENGTLEYSYQLDGNYRPQYYIEVHKVSTNSSNEVVKTPIAKKSFTDSLTYHYEIDSAGANDQPGQKDLTKMGVNYDSLPTTIYTTWNWDKINWTGNNSGDACNLFDTDGDGNANYSLCVVVKGSPAVLESTILYSCNDTRPDRCQGASSLSTTASCSVSVENDDPFTNGEEYPKDTVAKCTIPMADFSAAGAYLLDVCSYPSSQPNSDPSDCIIAQQQNGLISVIKDVVPNNDNTNWVFNISGKTNHVEYIRGDGFTGSLVSKLGTYSITETAGDNTNISLYTTTWACTKNGEAYLNGSGTVINNLNLGKSGNTPDTIVCKFTNTLKEGYLTVKKIVNGSQESPSTFSFKVNNGNDIQFENDGQNDLVVLPGTYNIVENSNPYYTTTYDNCSNLEILNGETETCTITNTLKESSLTVIKVVTNDNGGTKLPSDFNLYINGVSAISGQAYTLPAGNYTVTEDGDNGYSATFSGACDSDGKVTLNPGDDKTCVITNDDISPELTVIKKVVNDDGGDLQPSDFTMQVSGTHVSKVSFEGSDFPGVTVTLDAGNYSVDEINHDGYSKSLGTDCSGTISVGEKKTCIITNDDISPRLIVKKHVINDNGGNLHASDFTLNITGTNVSSHTVIGSETGVEVFLNAGSYSVDENNVYGYAKMIGDNCSGTITIGETKECTITNNDIQPTLKVTKLIKNTYEGTLLVTDVTLLVKSEKVESGIVNYFNAGDYIVSEEPIQGYTGVIGGDCGPDGSVTLEVGDNKECVITNYEIQPKLTVVKVVVNDDGGSKDILDFPLFVDGKSVISGEKNGFSTGTHTVSETQSNGYTASYSGACDSNGTVVLNSGDDKTCIITNDDIAPKLTIIKEVNNDNGGKMKVEDFPLYVNNELVVSGVKNIYKVGQYIVSEDGDNGYSATFSGACDSDGKVTLNPGDDKTCVITNDDISPELTVIKKVVNDDGGDLQPSDFTMQVSGTHVSKVSFEGSDFPGVTVTLDAGNYSVDEINHDGYSKSLGTDCSGTISVGEKKTCIITNDDIAPTLTVIKTVFNDNGGTLTENDFHLKVGDIEVISGVTNTFKAGKYTLTETPTDAYTSSGWGTDCSQDGTITLLPGDNKICTITNDDKPGILNVVKVVDTNNEINYSYGDFTFTLNGENEYKFDNEGKYNNVNEGKAGKYTVLENANPYYTTTYDNCAEVDVKNGEEQTCTITNTPIIPELEIIKTNNANQDKKIGDTVEYTIQLNIVKGYFVTDNSEINTQVLKEAKPSIEVFDVTPNGFKYIPGSWKGYLNDVAMDNFVLPEPTYSSPGNWKIFTDVKEGDVIKLVYSALISNEVDSGLYKDLAYAYGNTPFMTQEYAKGIGSWTNGTFVGTEVNVVNTAVQEEGVVLGVSTVELPRTGSSLILTIVALIIGVIGLLSVILGFNLKINKKLNSLILGLVTTFMLFITFGNKADAAYILRVEEPKSVTKSTFNIDYVALDTTGNTVNVKCEVIKPSTTSVIFSNKTTKVGGDSDKCEVTMAELNEGDGKYTFKVIANDDISTMQTFDVIYDTQKPLAPVSFKKTENTCSYKIEFKTANDAGQTVKVEIFRSTQKSFEANDSTLVGTVSIGSDTQGFFNNDKPNCNNDYFYAIRSVDAAGNTSDFIGDKITETKIVIVNAVNNNNANNSGNQPNNNGEVAGAETNENNGKNDEDKNNNGVPDNQENEQTDNKGDVEGSETSNQNVERNNTVAIVSGIALGSLLIWQLSKYGILQTIFQKIMKIFVRK